MPNGLKVAVAFNLLAVFLIGWFAMSSGGFTRGVFPPDGPVQLQLTPLPPAASTPVPARPQPRLEVPAEFSGSDPSVRPWVVLPDGSIRFRD